jgi:general secretion pathway protein G
MRSISNPAIDWRKQVSRRESGFTLVELLIVLAILAVLAAVVIYNITGIFARGGAEAWATDGKTLQGTVATFYFDKHACNTADAWNSAAGNLVYGHYYPTSTAAAPDETIDEIIADADSAGNTYTFPTEAIWMGLLYNSPGATSTHDKDGARPLTGEMGPYLNLAPPKSASPNNFSASTGSYTWVIDSYGRVYGIYWDDTGSQWVVGYAGVYP